MFFPKFFDLLDDIVGQEAERLLEVVDLKENKMEIRLLIAKGTLNNLRI
jgi:hypothetical protein